MKRKRRNTQKQGTTACPESEADRVRRLLAAATGVEQSAPIPLLKYSTKTRRLYAPGKTKKTPSIRILRENLCDL